MKEINIGMLVNTHGLRGEMKVKAYGFSAAAISKGGSCASAAGTGTV